MLLAQDTYPASAPASAYVFFQQIRLSILALLFAHFLSGKKDGIGTEAIPTPHR